MIRSSSAFLLCIAFAAPSAQGQTLDHTNSTPQVGDSFISHESEYIDPSPGGPEVTWDFSGLTMGGSITGTYVTPASTGHAAGYPGATLALDLGNGLYGFIASGNEWVDDLGIVEATSGMTIAYQDPIRTMVYPCSYNTTWTDPYSGTYSMMGLDQDLTGTISGHADGYGTVVMPYGTITNVLRVRTVEERVQVIAGVGSIESVTITHSFHKPGIRHALLSMTAAVTDVMGTITEEQYGSWIPAEEVGVHEALHEAIGIDVFPNPATDQVAVVFGSGGGSLRMQVLDGTGRVAIERRRTGQP
ncbi:MAG: hypothetical protein RBT71_05810, partial [Flavobacteriales bacterium]|nr:hypothetical protein [Flavobacteriales bacterium]